MAVSLPKLLFFPFKKSPHHDLNMSTLLPKNLSNNSIIPIFNLSRKSTRSTSTQISCKAFSTTDRDSLSSMMDELETQTQEEEEEEEEEEEQQGNLKKKKRLLADCWREIHGQDDWEGLLDPIDPLLRSELIRYGEMAQACYDAFDYDPFSKYCGSCRYNRRKFFDSLGLTRLGYDVSRYLYATTNINLPNFFKKSVIGSKMWSPSANWIGYISVSNDETSALLGRRDIAIAWRGTVTRLEWLADLMDFLRPISADKIPCPDPTVKVESGFLDVYTDKDEKCRFCKYSAREQVLTEIKRVVSMYPEEELSITVTGHSLGGALAVLSAYDVVETGVNVMGDGREVPVCVYSFSGPRVGNGRFRRRLEGLGAKVLRVVNVRDTVPKVPGLLFNERVPSWVQRLGERLPWAYEHVGVELALDSDNSPFLKETSDAACFHNLETHLHLLDGYHGKGHRFVLASGRDPALVNKASDFLKDHYLVPPNWRQDENKGMVRNEEGRWIQPERPKHHLDDQPHPPDIHHHLKHLGLIDY